VRTVTSQLVRRRSAVWTAGVRFPIGTLAEIKNVWNFDYTPHIHLLGVVVTTAAYPLPFRCYNLLCFNSY
jgi:hypothetical protein